MISIVVSVVLLLVSLVVLSVDMNKPVDMGYKIWTHYSIEQVSRKISSILYVEVALILEITLCPLTDMNRDSNNNLQDKVVYQVLRLKLITAYL